MKKKKHYKKFNNPLIFFSHVNNEGEQIYLFYLRLSFVAKFTCAKCTQKRKIERINKANGKTKSKENQLK